MPPHPDVFVAVAHEVDQRRHDVFAVAGEHVARGPLEQPVAQQRHERRHVEVVAAAQPGRALDGVAGDVDVGIEHQRHEQRTEGRVGDAAEGSRHLRARAGALLARVVDEGAERVGRRAHIRRVAAVREGGGRGDHQGGIGILQIRAHQGRGLLALHRRQCPHRGAAHVAFGVSESARDAAQPAIRAGGTGGLGQAQHARPHIGMLVVEHQRAHQVPLVERLEQVETVDDALGILMRQFLDQRLDRGKVGRLQANFAGLHVLVHDAVPERRHVFRARPQREHHPQHHDRQAGVAQLLPGESQAPVFDQHQDQQRARALRQTVDGDVDERLGAVLHVGGQRQEQDLAGGLVDRVAQRRVEHAGHARRPQRAHGEHQQTAGAEADRQDHQGEADAQQAVDTARERHLDEQADERQVDRDLRQERGDAVGVGLALGLGRRHVELLLDDGRADGGKRDHERDDLQVARPTQQRQRFAAADALLFPRLRRVGLAGAFVAADDAHDDEQAHHHDAGAHEQHRLGAEFFDESRGDGRAGGAAQAGAAADQPEQTLGLARVVDVVGQRPELADEQNAEDQPEQIEADRDPLGADLREQHPEEHQQHDHAGLGDRDRPAPRHRRDELRVGLHDQANHHAGPELHPRQVVGAQARDELRARDRLDDVVRRHRQERVEEEQQRSAAFARAQFGDRGQPAGEQGRTRSCRGHGECG